MSETLAQCFDRLVAPHLASLWRVAYRLLRNASDAEDLVQDTCIIACENLSSLKAATRPGSWLLKVLHNRFIDGARHRKRSPLIELDEADAGQPLMSPDPGPEDVLVQGDGERALERAYLKLDAMQRTLLVLRAEGYGLSEIESVTGLPKEVLRARLHRARSSLARHLEEQSEASHTPARTGSNS